MICYYACQKKDGRYVCVCGVLNPYLMAGDYPVFDTAEECIRYWRGKGIVVEDGEERGWS